MVDYEHVLKAVEDNFKRLQGGAGNVRGSVHGGAHFVDEEHKNDPNYQFTINDQSHNDKAPLLEGGMDVAIA